MKKHVLFLFATLLPLLANAEKVEIDGIWYNLDAKAKQAEVTYKGKNYSSDEEYSGSVTIPATITYEDVNYSVTSIGNEAFRICESLTSITIPEGVTSIGICAFSGCSSLTSVTIPESMTSIGSYAFSDCSSLTAITIPEGVTSIGGGAFLYCRSLTSIICKATTPPTIGDYHTFYGVSKSIPVYVPVGSMEAYKAAEHWSEFSNIQPLIIDIAAIILNQSSATLLEGESITLTATISPDDATDGSLTWSSSNEDVAMVSSKGKVITLAAGITTITATANDGSGVSASCEVRVVLGKCEAPTINYVDGKVLLTCDTEGAKVITTTTDCNANKFEEFKFDFIPTYTLTAYATKANYEDSDVATLTLCWIPCDENHEESDGIVTIPSTPVLISARDGVITLSSLAEGTEVTLYTTDGTMVAHQQSYAGEAKFTVDTGQVYLVHIGDKVVKIGM